MCFLVREDTESEENNKPSVYAGASPAEVPGRKAVVPAQGGGAPECPGWRISHLISGWSLGVINCASNSLLIFPKGAGQG